MVAIGFAANAQLQMCADTRVARLAVAFGIEQAGEGLCREHAQRVQQDRAITGRAAATLTNGSPRCSATVPPAGSI